MSRKVVPALVVAIAIPITALAIVLVLQFESPQRQLARSARTLAIKTLLSTSQGNSLENLHHIKSRLNAPWKRGGSLDGLKLFLSKDPGRRDFAEPLNRSRFRRYLNEDTREAIKAYQTQFVDKEIPNWVPEYVSTVRALFDVVKKDLLILSGVPTELTFMPMPLVDNLSITENVQLALENFADTWIPRNETSFSYTADRQRVRSFLLGNWRFRSRLMALDTGWKKLAASLYNLSVDENWILATKYHPPLQTELDELCILVLSADIHRRGEDLLALIAGVDEEPGINWVPNLSYYKNIPELSGYISDEEPTIFIARVNLGYTSRDGGTQTWLNQRKDWLGDYFNTFFSEIESSDVNPIGAFSLFEWRTARLKATALHHINSKIVLESTFGSRGIYGVRDLALLRINLLVD